MIRLLAVSNNPSYLAQYMLIRDSKQMKTRLPLIAKHALIQTRYNDFQVAAGTGSLDKIVQNPDALKLSDDLRACYNGTTAALTKLKKAIKSAQPSRRLKYCPMCGTTLPTTFDHYLPAVKFPEFSVHPLNLVPCCARCNSTKDDDWLSGAGQRQYIHAYTDTLPDLQFLAVNLFEHPNLKSVGATFSISKPATISAAAWNLIESHFGRLGLLDKYDEQSNDQISEILSDCKSFTTAADGTGNTRDFLKRQAIDRTTTYGRNHWLATLMQTMSEHPNLGLWVAASA
jgi:5-methylcytosine-specific restriction endonuclease McrA